MKALVILGPTATGKTDLALKLAKKFNGEIISADSRQVYKGLDIGTGKETQNSKVKTQKLKNNWMMDGINVWMLDVIKPEVRFTVKDYIEKANKVLEDIIKRGKLPIIVGGTGLYIKGLVEGFSNLEIPIDPNLRKQLEELPFEELQNKLKSLSAKKWDSLNNSEQNNPRRILRAIEIILMNPYKKTEDLRLKTKNCNYLLIGLSAPREVLNQKIDLRLDSRISAGLMEEVESLYKNGLTINRMKELGLEYGVLSEVLQGISSKSDAVSKLKIKIHQYAKRQLTYFNKLTGVFWYDITDQSFTLKIEKKVASWYHS